MQLGESRSEMGESTPISFSTARNPTRAFALLAAALATGHLSCSGAGPEHSLAATRGYLLISIDTLRADHLGCYGYSRDTSPFIDSLAARGALFENAYVQLPGTLPSHMSIFTGLFPEQHGVFPPAGVLSPEIETLPEAFRRSGFRTAGHTEGGYVHGGYGFARGFDEFDHAAKKIESDIERTLSRGLDFLRRLSGEDRFFLFLHSYVVHDPYFPPKEYLDRFWQQPKPDVFAPTGPNLAAVNREERALPPDALEFFRASYDGSISYMDDVLRGFFEELERLGLLEQITVIITSDHGEEFLEHGKLVHEQIYPESLHVPLVVLHPALAEPRRISTVVQSVDIAPTLYDIAAIEPRTPVSGRSLGPLLAGSEENGSEAFAVGIDTRHRALIQRQGESLHELILSLPPGSESGAIWVSRYQTFDTFGGELELEARSFYAPRQLALEVDGEPRGIFELEPHTWTALRLDLAKDGEFSRVRLRADDCTVPVEVGVGGDRRCLSFQVRGDLFPTLELFDLASDPLAAVDVAKSRPKLLREMLSILRSYDLQLVAAPETQVVDPQLQERLRALGYLQ